MLRAPTHHLCHQIRGGVWAWGLALFVLIAVSSGPAFAGEPASTHTSTAGAVSATHTSTAGAVSSPPAPPRLLPSAADNDPSTLATRLADGLAAGERSGPEVLARFSALDMDARRRFLSVWSDDPRATSSALHLRLREVHRRQSKLQGRSSTERLRALADADALVEVSGARLFGAWAGGFGGILVMRVVTSLVFAQIDDLSLGQVLGLLLLNTFVEPLVVAGISEAIVEGAPGVQTRFGPAYGRAVLAELVVSGLTFLVVMLGKDSLAPALVVGGLGLLAIPGFAVSGAYSSRQPELRTALAEALPPEHDLPRDQATRPVILGFGFSF